ncbi:hypothetical protein D9619_001522 [Psilocybe cf. subviscida]|uniref:Clathrin/coatomer adaptor adaptin-like N-terminal domain-containing protein n=1 Tax=Psilocybe cf. subviscida TaxID=2480587 RepID=A0A8H5BDU2_9AGAR|nr:hypothetical protein D9619_001522 [Psilocybe cf. subviscida]
MDVPFRSSGAVSRAHYALVRKIESANTVESADQDIFLEINSLHAQLSHPRLSLEKCKECLVILLYCANLVTSGYLRDNAFDFAFHHAINLAESGKKVEDKRIGYLFCSEVMPLNHEMRLMLINTLRKDLESDDDAHICLALDNLIASPTEDVIPAVQSRLHDLLSHDIPYIRRRALLAFRSLSRFNEDLMHRIHEKIIFSLEDPDDSVVQATLVIAGELHNNGNIRAAINKLFRTEATPPYSDQPILLPILWCLTKHALDSSNVPILYNILQELSTAAKPLSSRNAVILAIFQILSQCELATLLATEKSKKTSAVQLIRYLLSSYKPNDLYTFLSCLQCIDASLWAGTTTNYPPALDAPEFERIMQLLAFPDEDIRKKVLRIVKCVDASILDSHVSSMMQNIPKEAEAVDNSIPLLRILETRLIQCEDDGGEYARQVLEMLRQVDEAASSVQILKGIIQVILTDIRRPQNPEFLPSCGTSFVTVLSESEIPLGPTALVIATALATEFCDIIPTSPTSLLSALATRLKTCPSAVQEPCIIAMLRLRANCNEVPPNVIQTMESMSTTSRKLIRFRCTQFLEFIDNRALLERVVRDALTPSLPDFLISLQRYTTEAPRSFAPTPQLTTLPTPRIPASPSKLRYDAYAPSEALPSLRKKTVGSSSRVDSQSRSPAVTGMSSESFEMDELQLHNPRTTTQSETVIHSKSSIEATRPDLISLESPFGDHDETTGAQRATHTQLGLGEV